MNSLNLTQFDQAALLFFVFAAIGLIRERKILPFLIVAVGCLLNGPLAAVLLTGLILWHRIDTSTNKWIQLKDVFGFFLILIGAIAGEPYQELTVLMGATLVSLSFGKGGLGVIPPLLLLRQYVQHPDPIELPFVGAGAYVLVSEIVGWAKLKHAKLVLCISEVVFSLLILVGMRELAPKLLEEPGTLVFAGATLLVIIVLAAWVNWKNQGFWSFYKRVKMSLGHSLVSGKRFVSNTHLFSVEPKDSGIPELEFGFNQLFILVVGTLLVLGGFLLLGKGGFA